MKNKKFYFLLSVLTGIFLLEGGSPRQARAQADEDTVRCAQSVSKAMVDFIGEVTGREQKIMTINPSQSHLLELDVRQTAYLLWMLFITLSFSIPAFATLFKI